MAPILAANLETYLRHLVSDRRSAVPETVHYGYLQTLLNAVGEVLPAPHVRAVLHPANRGAGIPDLGLFAADQPDDANPAHGVVEATPAGDAVHAIARGEQVRRYLLHYRLVLVTNYYQFLLVTLGADDQPGRPCAVVGQANAMKLRTETAVFESFNFAGLGSGPLDLVGTPARRTMRLAPGF